MKNNTDLILKHNVFDYLERKIESEDLNEDQEDVILTFIEQFLRKTMQFACHITIKERIKESTLIDYLKPLASRKNDIENGIKAHDILACHFKSYLQQKPLNPPIQPT